MSETKKTSVSPVKIGIISLLSLVLVGVLIVQFALPAISSASATASLSKSLQDNVDSLNEAAGLSTAKTAQDASGWPVMTIEEIVGHDPFQLPSRLVKKDQSESPSIDGYPEEKDGRLRSEESLNAFQQSVNGLSVDQIVIGANGKVAMIGSTRLRVGDVYQGLLVIEIHRDGIVVVPAGDE